MRNNVVALFVRLSCNCHTDDMSAFEVHRFVAIQIDIQLSTLLYLLTSWPCTVGTEVLTVTAK